MSISEYDVSYAVKEYLIQEGYVMITWNPPGSQGTFTIPNPNKPKGRGQTGSQSPDLIAWKGNEFVIIEAKDDIKKSMDDIEKLRGILSDSQRMKLLIEIIRRQIEAKGLSTPKRITTDNFKIGVAIPYSQNYQKTIEARGIDIFIVSASSSEWTSKVINLKTIKGKPFTVERVLR